MNVISGINFKYDGDTVMDDEAISSGSTSETEILSDSGTPVIEYDEEENMLDQRVCQIFNDQSFCYKDLSIKYNDEDAHASINKWLTHAVKQMQTENNGKLTTQLVDEYPRKKIKTSTLHGHATSHAKGRRNFMEDAACAFTMNVIIAGQIQEAKVYAVFDGHGKHNMAALRENKGIDCSQYCKKNIQRVLKNVLEMFCVEGKDFEIYDALKLSFVLLDEEYRMYRSNKFPKIKKSMFGTTASVSMILQNKLWVANVGDTRTFISNSEKCIPLTYDAKAGDSLINGCISKRNGKIRNGRVNGTLAVCRALGNEFLRNGYIKIITPRPKIVMLPLEDVKRYHTYLVIACDGFFEGNTILPVSSTEQVHNVVQTMSQNDKSTSQISSTLVASALNAGTGDNLTVMVVPL